MDEPREITPSTLFVFGFFFELALVFVGALIGYSSTGNAFPFRLAADVSGMAWGLGASVPLLGLAFLLTSPVTRRIRPLQRIYEKIREILGAALPELRLQEVLLLSCAAGVGEEVLFRGALQTVLGAHGLWVSSLLFGALHAMTFTYFSLATLIGLYLGALFEWSGNLLAPILVHALYDALALWLLRKRFLEDNARDQAVAGSP